MSDHGYWSGRQQRRFRRRTMLEGALAGGAGLALAACSSSNNNAAKNAPAPAVSSAAGSVVASPQAPVGTAARPAGGTAAPAAPGASPAAAGVKPNGSLINGKDNTAAPKPGGNLQLTNAVDPVTWDPQATTSIYTHLRTCTFSTPLLRYRFGPQYGDADVTASPNLATSWEQVDPTTIKFSLDPNAAWTTKPPLNGRKLKSSDIAFSLNRIVQLPAPFALLYAQIDSMQTPDDATLLLKLKQPYAPIFNYLAHYYSVIVAPEVVQQFGDLSKVESAMAGGLGAFELDSWKASTSMVFKKRPNYFVQGRPYLDSLTYTYQSDANAILAAFKAGDVDISGLTFDQKDSALSARKDLVVFDSLSSVAWEITFRLDQAPYSDDRVRQAIALGIDRKGWLSSLYNNEGAIDNGPVQPLWSAWHLDPAQQGDGAKYYNYDPQAAKQLLAAAGVNNLQASFTFTTGYGQSIVQHTDLLKDEMSKIGVTLNVSILEYGAYIGTVLNSKPTYKDMGYGGVRFMGDPDEMLWGMYHPTGDKNFSKVSDPALTAMLEQQRATLDYTARKAIVDGIQKYEAAKLYYIYTPGFNGLSAWNPWVANYRPHVSYDTGDDLREVWIDPSLKKS